MTTCMYVYIQTTLLETNPYLLILTVVVSIVHSVFEFLAFKNGIINVTQQIGSDLIIDNDYIIIT